MELSKKQKAIIDVSIKLIAEKGIQSLTIKNIAMLIGVSEPAVYRHFRSKFDILSKLLDSFQEVSINVLNEEDELSLTSLEKIEYFLFDRYKHCSENPNLAKVMFSEENFQDDPRLAEKVLKIMHSHKERMQNAIVKGQESCEIRNDVDPDSLFRIIFGPMRLLIKQWCMSGNKFDIECEGRKLWAAEKKMIKSQ